MQISFASKKLKEICEEERALRRQHGETCARKVKSRLLDLEAASSLEVMRSLPGHCHELTKERAGQLALRLSGGKRLIIQPTTDPVPTKPDGGLDWSAVDAVEIVEIVDYHS